MKYLVTSKFNQAPSDAMLALIPAEIARGRELDAQGIRLKLYVEEYQLSEMRVAAGIWMVLVAIGLVLIVARIALGRSNKWLVMSNMALWGVALVDIQSIIAHYNVRH